MVATGHGRTRECILTNVNSSRPAVAIAPNVGWSTLCRWSPGTGDQYVVVPLGVTVP